MGLPGVLNVQVGFSEKFNLLADTSILTTTDMWGWFCACWWAWSLARCTMQALPTPLLPSPSFSLGHCTSGWNRRFVFLTSFGYRTWTWNPLSCPGAWGGKSWKEEAVASVCSGRLLVSCFFAHNYCSCFRLAAYRNVVVDLLPGAG